MPLLTTQPLTNLNPLSIDGRIDFAGFDYTIDEYLEKKQFLAHQLITSSTRPEVIWALREWVIKSAGYFDIVGYIRVPELTYWFEHDAIVEDFDELLLLFRDYVINQKGIEPEKKYRLVRYKDNLNFILVEKIPGESEDPTDLGYSPQERFVSELWPELQKEFVKFQSQLEEKYGHRLDIAQLFDQTCWDGNNLLWKAMHLEINEE